jgi:hypothetical protein
MDCQASGAKVGEGDGVKVTVAGSAVGEDGSVVATLDAIAVPVSEATFKGFAAYVEVAVGAGALPAQAAIIAKIELASKSISSFLIGYPS